MHNAICSRLHKRRLSPTVTSELSPLQDFSEAHFRLYHRRSFAAIRVLFCRTLHHYPYVIVAIVQNACITFEKQNAILLSLPVLIGSVCPQPPATARPTPAQSHASRRLGSPGSDAHLQATISPGRQRPLAGPAETARSAGLCTARRKLAMERTDVNVRLITAGRRGVRRSQRGGRLSF